MAKRNNREAGTGNCLPFFPVKSKGNNQSFKQLIDFAKFQFDWLITAALITINYITATVRKHVCVSKTSNNLKRPNSNCSQVSVALGSAGAVRAKQIKATKHSFYELIHGSSAVVGPPGPERGWVSIKPPG